MSATQQMRDILDELMGTTRDGGRPKIEFDDYRVCKCYLLDCCPHEALAGTRMDIGECDFIHDPALKADYLKASEKREYNFEKEAYRTLERFISNIDKKVKLAIKNLKETQVELTEDANDQVEEIHKLGEQIGTKLSQAESLGAEGLVQESLNLMAEVEQLSRQKNMAEIKLRNSIPASQYQQQKLRVCEMCSAYLGIQDNDRRLADHFGGKLHISFINLRKRLIELENYINNKSDRLRYRRESNNVGRDRSRSRGRDRKRDSRSHSSRSDKSSRH